MQNKLPVNLVPPNTTENVVRVVDAVKRALNGSGGTEAESEQEIILDADTKKLLGVTMHSHEIIYKAKTVFPFTLFPTTLVIDKEKLTVVQTIFFWTAKITSVPIRDILNVEADIGPFFGSVHLTSRYFFTNPHTINYLSRKDTKRIQKLLQGFIIANERNIDCSEVDKAQLEMLLEHLGETNA